MKHLVLVVLICSLIALSAKAVNPTVSVLIGVSAKSDASLISGYLNRELRKLDTVRIVEGSQWDWAIRVIAVKHYDGLYALAVVLVKNRHMKPYLKASLTPRFKEMMGNIPEYYTAVVQTGYNLSKISQDTVVFLEKDLLR